MVSSTQNGPDSPEIFPFIFLTPTPESVIQYLSSSKKAKRKIIKHHFKFRDYDLRAGEMVQQFRAFDVLVEEPKFNPLYPHGNLQPTVTPIPGYLVPSSCLHGHQTLKHTVYILHTENTHTH